MSLYLDVLLPLPLDRTFTYAVPADLTADAAFGVRVLVPFGARMMSGFVVGLRHKKPGGVRNLRSVAEILDPRPAFGPSFLAFCRRLCRHYFLPLGEILPSAVPPSLLLRSRALIRLTEKGRTALEQGLLEEHEKLVAALLHQTPRSLRFMMRKSRLSGLPSLLHRMERKELVSIGQEMERVRRKRVAVEKGESPRQLEINFSLDERLKGAVATVLEPLTRRAFARFVLFAEPEKRETVYFELIKNVLSLRGKTVFLIPEISLTTGVVSRLKKGLGESACVVHHRMTDRQREREWERARQPGPLVVVGPRSALFSPLDDVRLIICDEEHDGSYGQNEGALFDLRKAAEIRAREESAACVFGSEMPAIETFYRAQKDGSMIDLLGVPQVPRVMVIASRADAGCISPVLEKAIRARLEKREPILLFFNRRGYASSLVCLACGFVPHCDRCDLALSYSKKESRWICRYCGNSAPATDVCPRCGGRLAASPGRGVETLAEELAARFPDRRVAVFTGAEAGRKADRETVLSSFRRGEIDILVGTHSLIHQTEVSPISLVGILFPEMILRLADFRSSEKVYQAIVRTFRFLRPGEDAEVIIQTADPDHFSIRLAARGDYRTFYQQEIQYRRLLDYPPFSFLAEVVFSGTQLRRAAAAARKFSLRLKASTLQVECLGPSLAPVSKVRGQHRVIVTLKSRSRRQLDAAIRFSAPENGVRRTVLLFE